MYIVQKTLEEWSGTGWDETNHKTLPKNQWGDLNASWGACSGGADGSPSIDKGWWSVSDSKQLGSYTDEPKSYESDYEIGSTWHQGAMSLWNNSQNRGDNSTSNNSNHIQYKWGLQAMSSRGNNSTRTGICVHPDGPLPNETHGCIGISSFTNAVTVLSHLSSSIKILVE